MGSSVPFPVFTIAGPPFDRGLQYGRFVKSLIDRGLVGYFDAVGGDDEGRRRLLARAAPFIDVIGSCYPDLLEEMRGVAAGAARALEEVVALNARTELLYAKHPKAEAEKDGCTAAAILPRKAGGRVIMGQNWDWRPAAQETAIVLRVLPETGVPLLTFVEAGMLARSGLNGAGIGLCGNFLQSERDFTAGGLPIPVQRRAILNATTLSDAIAVVLRAPRAFSSNHLIAHTDGEAVNLEAAPHDVFPIVNAERIITHANHFKAAQGRVLDLGLRRFPDSLLRDNRLAKHLGALVEEDVAAKELMAAFRNHAGFPASICRHLPAGSGADDIATVASVVMDLQERLLWLARGPVCENEYHPIPLVVEEP